MVEETKECEQRRVWESVPEETDPLIQTVLNELELLRLEIETAEESINDSLHEVASLRTLLKKKQESVNESLNYVDECKEQMKTLNKCLSERRKRLEGRK